MGMNTALRELSDELARWLPLGLRLLGLGMILVGLITPFSLLLGEGLELVQLWAGVMVTIAGIVILLVTRSLD